jgi:hypothetical protein
MFGGCRQHNRERRVSARRGFVNPVCNSNATNFGASSSHALSAFHGGLTPPALVLVHDRLAGEITLVCDARTHSYQERRA